MTIIGREYPKTLYVKEEEYYPYVGLKHFVGREDLKTCVRDDNTDNEIAVYQLVSVDKYRKTVIKTETVEKV